VFFEVIEARSRSVEHPIIVVEGLTQFPTLKKMAVLAGATSCIGKLA